MQVELFKKKGSYTDKKTGELRDITNFYVKCGDSMIRVEVPYFPDPNQDGKDPNYASRRSVLSAFASEMPERESDKKKEVKK